LILTLEKPALVSVSDHAPASVGRKPGSVTTSKSTRGSAAREEDAAAMPANAASTHTQE
jgi:hypothetical protein